MGAAFYYTYTKGMSILPINIGVNPVSLKILDPLQSEDLVTIITDAQISLRDTNQFFMSFDDKIHHSYFGKGLGSFSVQGLILPNCDGQLPGVKELFDKIGEMRGKVTTMSAGSHTFDGVLIESTITFSSEPTTNAIFQLNFAMIDHNIAANRPDNIKC